MRKSHRLHRLHRLHMHQTRNPAERGGSAEHADWRKPVTGSHVDPLTEKPGEANIKLIVRYLVGGLEHFLFFHILGISIPIG